MNWERVKPMFSRWDVQHRWVRFPNGYMEEVAPRSWVLRATGGERCYMHGVRVPRWFYYACLRRIHPS